MSKRISAGLRKFLKAWLKWAEAGGIGYEFSHSGLCANASNSSISISNSEYVELRCLLGDAYPFGGASVYYDQRDRKTAHKNPLRLAWVRKTLGIKPKTKTTTAPKTKPVAKTSRKKK